MKLKILLFLSLISFMSAKAQLFLVENQTFEGSMSTWIITPTASWKADTNLYAAGKTSYRGIVPIGNNPGDTAVITTPMYDFTGLPYVWLSFSHICKVSGSDICQIEYREDNLSSTWQPIPTSSYEGSGIYINARFSHASYSDWLPNDSLATPTNGWWKNEQFDVSNEVSLTRAQFRFKITRGTALGSYFAHGWLIDNFQITASANPIDPPVVEFITNYSDTLYHTGPYEIQVKAATRTIAPILKPKLYYTATIGGIPTNDSIVMTAIEGDSIWSANIPQHFYGTTITYAVVASDSVGNTNSANGGFYIKRPPAGGYTGYVIVGNGTVADYYTPASMYYKYSWARMLYLSNEISSNSLGGFIHKLAWNYDTTSTNYTNQSCYFKAVDDTALVTGYLDPILDGASQVWTGQLNLSKGWVEIILNTPFYLPPGKNLQVYWHHEHGAYPGSAYHWNHTSTSPTYRTVQAQNDGSFPSGNAGSLRYDRPNARFFVVSPSNDSNAVALHSIDNPTKGTVGGTQPVKVTIKNRGLDYLDSCIINWSVNGVLQSPVVWRGHLLEDFNDTITVGYYTQRYNLYDSVVVWVGMPNGVVDTTTWDDTLSVVSYGCYGSISGDFIVGTAPGADVPSMNDAFFIASMCGVSGDVTLKFQNGTYAENWDFTNLADVMGNYTLTITSLSGNRDSVVLKPASDVAITFNNTNNFIVKDITIDNTSNNDYGIEFTGTSNNIEIRNIHFIGDKTGTSSTASLAPIYKSSGAGLVDDVRFIGNTIEGGYYGIYFYGGTGTSAYGTNVIFDSNMVFDQYYYATYFYYTDFTSVSYNTIYSRTLNAATTWYGLRLYNCDFIANANRIHGKISIATFYGVYFYNSGNTLNPSLFANNEIIGITSSTYYGIYSGSTSFVDIINNSIHMSGSGASRNIYIANDAGANYTIKNNLLVNTSSGYPIYFSGSTTPFTSDYNCLYGNTNVGYISSARTTLAAWQTATGQDANSISVNPTFIDISSNLKLNNYVGFECNRLTNVNHDIEGTFRNVYTSMGCYATPLVRSNAALTEILQLNMLPNIGDSSNLEVLLLNAGLDTIKAATINWTFNGITQPTIHWTGNLASQYVDTVLLGKVIYQGGFNEIVVWLSGIGSMTDSISYDDTLMKYTYACYDSISGNFIVGNQTGADVNSIEKAIYIAQLCGVKGNITLSLQNGVYEENWNFSNMADILGNYTIEINSLSGNKDSVILRPATGNAIVLNNTNNIHFNNITIDAINGLTALNIMGNASNIAITNCKIFASDTATNNTYAGIYKSSSSSLLDRLILKKCLISGGYYGIYIVGTSSGYDQNITIDSNIFSNQFYYGVYLQYVNSNSTSYNRISPRSSDAGANWYGIYLNYNRNGGNIIGNRIYADNSNITTNLYGMRTFYIDSALVANNEIILNSTASTTYGIYIDYPKAVDYVHNSILLTGTSNTARAAFWYVYSNTTYDASMMNNIFISNTSGTTPYAIYLSGTYSSTYAANYRIDYNNYYSSGNLGYVGSAKSDLASWKATVISDVNSINVYPSFVDSTLGLRLNDYTALICPKYPGVDNDIDDNLRLNITSMGCYTPLMQGADAALIEVINWKTSAVYAGDTSHLKVVLFNAGSTALTSATMECKINNVLFATIHWTGSLTTGLSDTVDLDTLIYQSGYNNLIVYITSLGSLMDTTYTNDTIRVSNYTCDSILNGYYTIGASGDFVSMDEAVNVLNICGINGPVTFAIQPGTYRQNTTIGYINGTSPTNTITFTSTTGDSTDVILQRADDASSSIAPLMITNGKNIIIEKLTLSGLSPLTSTYTYSHGIIISDTSRNIEVRNCHIYGPKNFGSAVTGTNQNPVRIKGASIYDVRILNNLIEGGSCGVYVYGSSSSSYLNKVVIKDNTIGYIDTYGMYLYYGDSIWVEGNVIKQRSGNFTPGDLYGIYTNYVNADIIANKIHAISFYHALYLSHLNDGAARPALVANNEIIGNQNSSTTRYGIYAYTATQANIFHNSIYLGGDIVNKGIYLYYSSTAGSNTSGQVINNNIVMSSTDDPYPIYLSNTSATATWNINYNNYYNVNGINIGYAGNAKTSLSAWKATVTSDINSVNIYPNFLDINTSMMLLDSNGLSCPSLIDVPFDIQDNIRPILTTMGAYHYEPAQTDALPFAFTSLSPTIVTGVTTPISLLLLNNGLDTLTSVMIACEINGIAITPTTWTGVLLPGDTTTVQLGAFIPQSFENSILVYTYLPNGITDQFTLNDTLRYETYACDSVLGGTYTIGATGDFTTIDKAIKAIENCGINASVVFEIQNGTYTNHLSINQIPGASDTNTVTFVSQARDASSVIINVANTAIRLNDAAHLNFRYLTVYGSVLGVDIVGSCTNVEFYACSLATYASSDNSMYRVVNYANTSSSGNYLKDVRFIKNTLSGGYYSMYLYYAGSSNTDIANCLITVDSNTMVNAYYYGIYSYYYAKYKSISYNTITLRSTTDAQYGIYTYYTTIDNGIIGNKIVTNTSNTNYGIRLYYINRYAANGLALIANNEVLCNGGSNTVYGLYCYYNTAMIYHNSVSLYGTGDSYGLYIGTMSSTYQMILKNNIFATYSTGTPYAIYASTAANATQAEGTFLDYNNYYSAGSNVGYIGSAKSTLAALQTATGQDQNSINVNPNFVGINDLRLTSYTGFDCPRMQEVQRDKQNYLRSSITNMGAYVGEPSDIDAQIVEFIGFSTAYANGSSFPISVVVRNAGFTPLSSATISGQINGVDITPVAYTNSVPLQYGEADTVSIGSYVFTVGTNQIMVAVTMNADTIQENDTIRDSRYMCANIMGGEYVIGASPLADYSSVDLLMNDILLCGINGDITMKFESGTYNGSWDLTNLDYFLGNYTLTVTSVANHRDSVIFASTSGALVTLNNTHNVRVHHVTLNATAGTFVVQFTGDASNITFDQCNILANTTTTANTYAAIYKATSTGSLNGLTIKHCLIDGGYYGVYIYGTSSNYANEITIDSNILSNQYYYGIYLYYVNSKSTSYNFVTPRSSNAGTTWYGIWVCYNRNGGNIIGNRIFADNSSISSTLYGMRTYYIDSAIVANNDIYLNSSASTTYGIYLDYPIGCKYLHNSILINGTSNTARAFYWYVYSNTTYDATLKNNIFISNSSGTTPYAIYLAGTYSSDYVQNYRIDYNNYYSTGSMGYVGSAQPTLANWMTIVVSDQHSTFSLPNFVNPVQSLKLLNYSPYITPIISDMPYDMEYVSRGLYTAKGAYEMNFYEVDAFMIDFDTTHLLYNQPSAVTVHLMNLGLDTLTSTTIRWTFNGITQTPFNWSGNLMTFESEVVNLGNVLPILGTNTLVAWVENPNNTVDSNKFNDTIIFKMFVCAGPLAGNYTVGGLNPDFDDLEEVNNALSMCGVSDDVNFYIRSGSYGNVMLMETPVGTNDSTIVTFTSVAADADSVNIVGSPALSLMNTSYYRFTHLTFDATAGGYAVQINGNTNNVEISNCKILADPNSTATSTAGIYKASSADLINDIRIIGNVIEGGYYGIYFYGGNSSSAYGTNVVIDSNIMRNQYLYANYFYYVDFNSLSHNTMLSRRTSTSTNWYGIRSYYCNFVADGNKIHQRSTAITSPYLVYIYYAGYYNASQPSLFCNNELIGSSSTTYYAMYLGTYNVLNVYNNSIYMDGTGASRCIYIASSTSSSFDFKNNIIVNASSSGHVVYFAGTTTPCISDYNCLYSPGNIGYFSSSYTTLAAWQSATGTDAHSISVNPSFVDVSSSLELTDYSAFIVPRLNNVTVDINDVNRTILTMMGAYSIPLFEGYNLELTEIISPREVDDIHCFADYADIEVVVTNAGTNDYDFSVNNYSLHVEVTGAVNYQMDTIISSGNLSALSKDTILLTDMLPVSMLGTYHINVYLSSAVDTVYTDDTLRNDYSVRKIQLPYDVDFSTRPAELVFKQVLGSVNWEVQSGTGSNPTIAPVFGTGRLHFASESGAGSIAQAIINGIDLRGSNQPTLEFWFAHDNSSYKTDLVEIKASTDGGATTQTLRTVYRYHAWYPTPGWDHIVVDLSAYTQESCLSLIFEASSFGGGNQNIDRIRIASKPDVAISLIAPKEEDLVACKTSNQRLKVVVSNMTTQYVDFDQDTTQIVLNVSGADVVTYTYPLSGQLAGLSSDTLEITQTFDMSNNGTYDLIAYIEAIDSNFVNDTSKATIQINNDLSIDKVVGVDAVNCKKIGDSVYVSFTVYNLGNLVVDEIPLSLQINGVNVIVDTVYTSLMPGDSLLYDFTEAYVVPVVTYIQPYYFVKVQTQLACDASNANNIREIMACVDLPEIVDLQIQTVNKPLETVCDTGLRTVYVSVTLANEGTSDISSAVLHVEIDSAGTPWASFSETTDAIPSEGTTTHIFSQGYIVPNFTGNYIVRVYVDSLSADENLTNDTLEILACAILDDVSIDAFGQVSWTMEQNIPNPARTNTRIPYAIPQEGAILFKVMSINGQVLYTKEIDAMAGSHSMEFDITTLSNGIYYYSMEYQGQRIVKKMTIQR